MASSGKKKTTMAKLNRERRLRERRANKEARKQARRLGLLTPETDVEPAEPVDPADGGPDLADDAPADLGHPEPAPPA